MTLIVDAAPIVALGDERDPQHERVRTVLAAETGELVIPAPVSAEIDYLLRRRGSARAGRRFLEDIAEGRFAVIGLTPEEHATALHLDEQYSSLELGLADLSVVVLAARYRTRRLLSFDERDFRQVSPLQGGVFTLLPADL